MTAITTIFRQEAFYRLQEIATRTLQKFNIFSPYLPFKLQFFEQPEQPPQQPPSFFLFIRLRKAKITNTATTPPTT